MNFMHLTDVFPDKSPAQIYDALKGAEGIYLDVKTGIISDVASRHQLIINDEKTVDFASITTALKSNRDLYENMVTSLSWRNLDKYLESLLAIEDLDHSMFIIDIATRNCIPLQAKLYTEFLRFRHRNLLVQYRHGWQNKTIQEIVKEAHSQIHKILNVLAHKDAYVRC